MPILEIITIGTELLLGEITDTNSTYIARTLRDHGVDIYRITTIGDNPGRITSTIKEALERSDIIITTGGLGPTVDDPTRKAVADAVDRKLVFDDQLWGQILDRFKEHGREPTENNRRQAYLPEGAIPIFNPVGTAPCYIVEVDEAYIISLPGVPREMETILHQSVIPYLKEKFDLKSQVIKATVLHAASMGESVIDEKIEDLEKYANPTVGLLSHPGQVDIRVTAKANSISEAFELSNPIVEELKTRLGDSIYGQDEETLESVVSLLLNKHHLKLLLIEHGLEGELVSRLKLGQPDQFESVLLEEQPENLEDFENQITGGKQTSPGTILFGVALLLNEKVSVHLVYQDAQETVTETRFYGGPRDYAPLWAQNSGIDFLRRQLMNHITHLRTGDS